jgi:hypothetical protein
MTIFRDFFCYYCLKYLFFFFHFFWILFRAFVGKHFQQVFARSFVSDIFLLINLFVSKVFEKINCVRSFLFRIFLWYFFVSKLVDKRFFVSIFLKNFSNFFFSFQTFIWLFLEKLIFGTYFRMFLFFRTTPVHARARGGAGAGTMSAGRPLYPDSLVVWGPVGRGRPPPRRIPHSHHPCSPSAHAARNSPSFWICLFVLHWSGQSSSGLWSVRIYVTLPLHACHLVL